MAARGAPTAATPALGGGFDEIEEPVHRYVPELLDGATRPAHGELADNGRRAETELERQTVLRAAATRKTI